jgi:hypothetical protein
MKTLILAVAVGFALFVCSMVEVGAEETSSVIIPTDIDLSDSECRTRQLVGMIDLKLSKNSQIGFVRQSSDTPKNKEEADKTIKVAGCIWPKACHCYTGTCCCW